MWIKHILPVTIWLTTWNCLALTSPAEPKQYLTREPATAFVGIPRQEMNISRSPYTAVGRLALSGNLWCTATLISRDLILTAAHCLFDENKNPRKGPFRFTPANWMNKTDSSLAVKSSWGTTDPAHEADQDFAIMRLEQPLGDIYGWMKVQTKEWSEFKRSVEVVSYSDDFEAGKKATYQPRCNFTFFPWPAPNRVYSLIGHNCASFEGASGASMFYVKDNVAYIVALNVRGAPRGCDHGPRKPCRSIPYNEDYANAAIPSDIFWPMVEKALAGGL